MGAGAIIGAIVAGGAKATGLAFASYTYAGTMLVGASIGRTFDKQKGASPTYSFGELDNTRGQRVPIPVTYGKVKVAGNIIYQRVSDDSKELFMVIGLGEGPIESVEDIRVNDQPIASVKGYVEHHVRLGTANQTAVSWVETGETWPNTAYIAVKFKASEDLTMTPTITCVVKGRKIRTWSSSQWVTQYSNNPAWCILDLLTNERYGVGIKERYIDLDSFRNEALYCDELVDDGKGGQEPRFRLDYNVDFQRSSLDLIDEILGTFRAYILYSDGKLRLQIEKSQVPVQSFTMDNIVADSFSYSMASLKEIPNRVRVEWIDPDSDWEQADITYDNEIDQEDRGEVLETAITLYGVTRPGQAGREARWYHDSVYICNTFCEFRVGIDSMHCEAGDIIKVSHDVPGWVEKEFRILEIQEEENDEMVLRCREYNSAIYHDRGSVYTQGRATELPNPNRPPAPVENLIVVETNKQLGDGTWVPQVLLSWDAPVDALFRAAHIYHSLDKGVTWQHVQRVVDSTDYLMDISLGENRFRVVSESSKGILGDPGASPVVTITVIGKNSPPPDVTWGECSFVDQVELRWNPVNVPDLQAYEVRTNTYWGSQDGLIYRGNGLSHVMEPTQRSYTFHIKALDRSGNYSKNASVITLSLPAPQAPEQPIVEAYFNALKIKVNPLNSPSVKGYYAYVIKGTETDKIPILAGGEIAYATPTGTTVTIQVSAYDVLGEGPKSEPLQATTTALTDGDIPDDIVGPSKLTEDLRSDIDLSKTQSAEAISLVGGFDDRITATETVLEDASQRLESAETELGAIDGKLTTQETKITNIEGELSSKVSQTDFDTLAGTVSSHGTTLTQHATAIEAKAEKSTVDTLAGRVTTAEGNITAQAGQIALKANASDVYTKTQVNTELGKKADKTAVDGLTTRVTDAELTINAHTGQIAQKAERTEVYTKTETDEKIDGIEIGGRNLVLDSITEHSFTNTIFTKPLRVDIFQELIGKELTLSFYAKANISGQMMDWYLRNNSSSSIIPGSQHRPAEIPTEYTRFTYTITLADITEVTNLSFAFRNTSSAGGSVRDTVYLKNIQIEKGNKPTDWTPAPEDVEAEIAKKVDTTTYNQKVGELTTSIDGITGRVSNTETNINNLTGEVSSVKSDVSQLEIKADGIQSTVTSLQTDFDYSVTGKNLVFDSRNGGSGWNSSGYNVMRGTLTEDWIPGERYIISIKGTVNEGQNFGLWRDDGSKTVNARIPFDPEKKLWIHSFICPEPYPTHTYFNRFAIYNYPSTGALEAHIEWVKIEKGNKATDWTPAPEDVDAEINTVSTQVTQLADRYSVKTQKTSGGKTYATGFVSGINEQNESEFAVLADRFRVFGTTTSDGQAVFAVDTVTKKAYFLADLIVNGLVRATALEAEQLKAHMIQAGYAVFDEANILDLEARKILAAGGAIEIGEEGIMMIPPGYAQRSMHLDGAQLAFWDKNNMPSIAMGDLTQARQNIINAGMTNLFPDGFVNGSNFPQYGFLMMQGNIALARSVLAHSLIEMPADLILDRSIQNRKLAQNAVTSYNIAPKAISLDKLADNIHVPSMNDAQILRASPANIDNAIVRDAVATLRSWTFNKKSGHYSAEQGRLSFDFVVNATASMVGQICFVVDGTTIACVSQYGGDPQNNYEIYVDLRGLSEAGIPMSITGQRIGGGSTRVTVSNIRFYQNNQLPLRIGNPAYAVIGGTPSGCYSGCEVTCESSCQATCQDSCETNCEGTCEKSCMTGCQTSCQATCEKTSQSGGGCIREGTPVDVWAIDTQEYITVPVEDLKRGMILPWYQPETDTVIHGELLELQDASYSNEFLRIRTHNGPSVDVTFSQPFDVLADLGQGQKWYKLQAMYLRPGMQLVRPFDTPDNRLSTIVSVETVREPRVHFWNPKTSTGGFCVNGYADMITK